MAKNENKRINSNDLQSDNDSLITLEGLAGYQSAKADYSLANVQTIKAAMDASQKAEKKAADALKTARDVSTAAEWAYHNAILGVKQQVIAQFGDDSAEIQLFGLKKKSEYKSPTRKAKV
ncbi:MAG: hypothetical protein V4714_10055 [Bacteroidota bacterium]